MDPAIITIIVLAVVAFFFVTELIPLAVTAMSAPIALGFFGVLKFNEVFSGLSNSTVVLFAGMFVVGTAMLQSGLAQAIGDWVVKKVGTNEAPLMAAMMGVTICMSAFASNTGTVACLMPVVMGMCIVADIPVSPFLMALAVAANTGGTITMVGTPPNIIAAGAIEAAGYVPYGFFEYAVIGIPLALVSVIYMVFIGRRLTPHRKANASYVDSTPEQRAGSKKKRLICTGILVYVIIGLSVGFPGFSQEMVAVSGAILCVLTRCVTEEEAYSGIDWVTIFLFSGMLPLATALDKTGAGAMIAHAVVGLMGEHPSNILFMLVLFCISCGLTQFMSNTASAALLCPIGISIAQEMGASPYPVVMAIGIAASCAFATPVATPPNTLVFGPGGFRFNDYVKVGTPLIVISLILCMFIIPMYWPFFPG